MLGFAVLDRSGDDVIVWLVSQTADAFADNTNAVTFDSRKDDAAHRVAGMLAERAVVLTPRVDLKDSFVTELDVAPVTTDAISALVHGEQSRLLSEFRAEQSRRKAAKQARIVQPPWPTFVASHEPDDMPPALSGANKICALWRCWLKLQVIRKNRDYLTAGDSATDDLPSRVLLASAEVPHE